MLCLVEKIEIANYPDDNIINIGNGQKHLPTSLDNVT